MRTVLDQKYGARRLIVADAEDDALIPADFRVDRAVVEQFGRIKVIVAVVHDVAELDVDPFLSEIAEP